MNKFTVNNIEYTAKAFDFNLICDLEDMGITMQEASNKPMSMVRAYFALCTGRNREYAGKEMEKHLLNGGTFEDVMNAMSAEMEKSDFFRKITENAKEEVAENTKEKK